MGGPPWRPTSLGLQPFLPLPLGYARPVFFPLVYSFKKALRMAYVSSGISSGR
jgi:hypothetical protein